MTKLQGVSERENFHLKLFSGLQVTARNHKINLLDFLHSIDKFNIEILYIQRIESFLSYLWQNFPEFKLL